MNYSSYINNNWKVPYIGRIVKENFKTVFSDSQDFEIRKEFRGKIKRFDWPDAPLDEGDWSGNDHCLEVELYDNGPLKNRIKHIVSHHIHYYSESNWLDHMEHHQGNVRVENYDEIMMYKKILDDCTEEVDWSEMVLNLFKNIIRSHKNVEIVSATEWIHLNPWDTKKRLKLSFLTHTILSDDIEDTIQVALTYPEVWFGWCKDFHPYCDADLIWFLEHIDIISFYSNLGLDVNEVFKPIINRMAKNSAETWKFMGLSDKVGHKMLEERFEELVHDQKREFEFVPPFNPEFWPRTGILKPIASWGGNDEPLDGIPTGSLCFMDEGMHCRGFVTKDGEIYAFQYIKTIYGHVGNDGIVRSDSHSFDWLGTCLVKVDGTGIYETINGRQHYHAWVEYDGMVFRQYSWVGYVCECIGFGRDYKDVLTAPYKKSNERDIRLGGLVFFAGVDGDVIKENARIRKLECFYNTMKTIKETTRTHKNECDYNECDYYD